MAEAAYQGVSKSFGATQVIGHVDLAIADGEFVVYVGPSGCGKTTLLRLLAGLESVSAGRIRIGGRDVTAATPKARNVAMVFQNYALYPHMTVAQNIGFGLRMRGTARAERDAAVARAAGMLGLDKLLERRPRELSGGQRQRVAMGRAIVREPDIFLMDEPLSNLDAQLRGQMRAEIRALQRRLGATMIYVTHDQVEAMTMADRIVVLRDGAIEQVGGPSELYERPATRFVAGFIGAPAMNILPLASVEDGVQVADGPVLLPERVPEGAVEIGLRPQRLHLLGEGEGAPVVWPRTVSLIEPMGEETLLHLGEGPGALRLRHPGPPRHAAGDPARVGFDLAEAHFFAADGRAIG